MIQYFADLPGLENALMRKRTRTYYDVGAGYALAAEQLARCRPDMHIVALSRTNFRPNDPTPTNMAYLLGDAKQTLEDLQTADVIADLYGAFTYDVYGQIDLMRLYMEKLTQGGTAHIRFDGDHIAVVTTSGLMMLFSEWLSGLHLSGVSSTIGPNPSGPTSLASVVTMRKIVHEFRLPEIKLSGIKQFEDDVVPFVVYGVQEK